MAKIDFLTITETAQRLGVSPNTITSWLWRGLLQRTKAGTRTLIAEDEIERFLAASTERADNLRRERRAERHGKNAAVRAA